MSVTILSQPVFVPAPTPPSPPPASFDPTLFQHAYDPQSGLVQRVAPIAAFLDAERREWLPPPPSNFDPRFMPHAYDPQSSLYLPVMPTPTILDYEWRDHLPQLWGAPLPPAGFTTIQNAVNAATAGTSISIPAGTYNESVTVNKALTIYAYGPVILDGQLTRTTGFAVTAANVTLVGFEVRNYKPLYQHGAIDITASNCTLRWVYSHDNPGAGNGGAYAGGDGHNTYGGGMNVTGGANLLVEDSRFEGNETCGMHINGSTTGSATIRRTVVRNNNPGGFNLGWHSGGIKGTQCDPFVVEDCVVTGNVGDGVWGDINMTNGIIRRNRIDHNTWSGVHWEISNNCQITDNVIWECGWGRTDGWAFGAGIQIVASRLIDITGNIVAWSNRGISVIAQERGSLPSSGPGNYSNISIEDNVVVNNAGTWLANWVDDRAGTPLFSASGNGGSGGQYWSNTGEPQTDRFDWSGSKSTLAAFNATPAEEGGVYLTTPQRDAILTAAGVPTTGEH